MFGAGAGGGGGWRRRNVGSIRIAARISLTGVFFIPAPCQLNAHFFNAFQWVFIFILQVAERNKHAVSIVYRFDSCRSCPCPTAGICKN